MSEWVSEWVDNMKLIDDLMFEMYYELMRNISFFWSSASCNFEKKKEINILIYNIIIFPFLYAKTRGFFFLFCDKVVKCY